MIVCAYGDEKKPNPIKLPTDRQWSILREKKKQTSILKFLIDYT